MSEVDAKLTHLCVGQLSGAIEVRLTLVAVATVDSDLKLGAAAIDISIASTVSAPSPVTQRINVIVNMTASGNVLYDTTIDAVSDEASIASSAFIGPGTINNLKKIVLETAFGSVEIYNNGAGGFHTLGGFDQIRTGRATINITLLSNAGGISDAGLRLANAAINIPVTQSSEPGPFIARATILTRFTMDVGKDLTSFNQTLGNGIVIPVVSEAAGNITNVAVNLTDNLIEDFGTLSAGPFGPRTRTDMKARIIFDYNDGSVKSELGFGNAQIELQPLTDWISAKSEQAQFPNLKLRASLILGSPPTFGLALDNWINWPTIDMPASPSDGFNPPTGVIQWEITHVNPTDFSRVTWLQVELSQDEGTTIIASATYKLVTNFLNF